MKQQNSHQNPKPQISHSYQFLISFCSGGLAGICAKSALAPIDRVKIVYQATDRQFTYKSAFNLSKEIYTKHGISNFWRGNLAAILRVFPYSAINFAIFDFLKLYFIKPEEQQNITNLTQAKYFIFGGISGLCSTFAAHPFDLIRTRMVMLDKMGT